MQKQKALSILISLIVVAFVVPQIILAAWWNPFSWGIWNKVFHKPAQQVQQQTDKQIPPKDNPSDKTNGILYINKEMGYQIKLPADWVGYRVINNAFQIPTISKDWYEMDANGNKAYGYGTVFVIEKFSLSDWNKMKKDCGVQGTQTWHPGCFGDNDALGRNNESVFVVRYPNSGPNVMGDVKWGKLADEICENVNGACDSFPYLKNNFSIIATDQTAGWKTYTNSQYGFEIKYKPVLVAGDTFRKMGPDDTTGQLNVMIQNHIEPNLPAVPTFWYNIVVKKGIPSLDALKKFYTRGILKPGSLVSTNTMISGLPAVGMNFIATPAYDHYVHAVGLVKDNTAYIISYWNDKETSQDEFNQMVSTFKFTK